jgi:hypothetical protein
MQHVEPILAAVGQAVVPPQAVWRQIQPQGPQRRRRILNQCCAFAFRGLIGQQQRRLQPLGLGSLPLGAAAKDRRIDSLRFMVSIG